VRLALSRLIAWSPHALCVCDARAPDAPIVFANDNFFTQTGYGADEVLGRNCRFLQGKGTDPETVAEMRLKIARGEEFSGKVLNYHKNGVPLMNSLVVSPLFDAKGNVSHYIGIQRLATAQALREAPAEYQHRAAL
jgi:non-specific serine/threonine protein kinase